MSRHILYTKEEGGDFHYISFGKETTKRFNKAKKDGYLKIKHGDIYEMIIFTYIMLVEEIDNYDAILAKKNG